MDSTRRSVVPALEAMLGDPIKILDHGFVRVVDYMGDDNAIVQAARVSYGKGTKQVSEDQGLINYLMRHRHSTPFEMCEIKFHVKLPIFVARQWIRHRTANVNEYSARYSVMDNEFYVPEPANMSKQSLVNKQGRGEPFSDELQEEMRSDLESLSAGAYNIYENMLKADLSRELARTVLPVNYYTQWYWKVDLSNFMKFIELRTHSHAQYEIRMYAEAMLDILELWCPMTYNAFMEYHKHGTHLSRTGMNVIRRMLTGEDVTFETSGLTKREWNELSYVLDGTMKPASLHKSNPNTTD